MVASGHVQKWYNAMRLIEPKAKQFVETANPQVLTVRSLKLGFTGFLIALTISLTVFLMEMIFQTAKFVSNRRRLLEVHNFNSSI